MAGERKILHIDMDAYFAALEVQACPKLAGKPVIVGALPGNRGAVASASYEARQYGIRAGMPITLAKRICPQAEFVPCHPGLYIHTSRKILEHLLTYTSNVEMFSIDEAFLDVTDLAKNGGNGNDAWNRVDGIARDVAGSIDARLNLSCSVGAGPNKLIAKMASDVNKPAGITLLSKEAFRSRFWHRPVDELYGVGEKTAASLMIFGIERIDELAHTQPEFLRGRFGIFGEALHAMAWGEDETPVEPSHNAPPAKSLGHEHTLQRDVDTPDQGLSLLLALTERVTQDLRSEGYTGRCIRVRMRYSDFSTLSRQRMLAHPTQETRDVYRTAKDLFLSNYCGGGIRLLGVTVGELMQTRGRSQLALFPEDRRYTRYVNTLDRIRDSFGRGIILPAGAMREGVTASKTRGSRHAPEKEGLIA
jgi:DNA polymerase-4